MSCKGADRRQHVPFHALALSQREALHMSVIFLLLTVSTLVAAVFLAGFIWAVRKGQYDDDRSPAVRILNESSPSANESPIR